MENKVQVRWLKCRLHGHVMRREIRMKDRGNENESSGLREKEERDI